MATVTQPYITPEEYLQRERKAETKCEYLNGEIFAMAGASFAYGLIKGNIEFAIRTELRDKPCPIVSSDLRAHVSASGLYAYPDVMVICGEPKFLDNRQDTVTTPILLVEVLSASTESYDRGQKFHYYRELPSLQEYVIVAHGKVHVEHYTRQAIGQWLLTETKESTALLKLPSLPVEIKVSDIYAKVTFA